MTATESRTDVVLPSLTSVYRTRGSVELKEFEVLKATLASTLERTTAMVSDLLGDQEGGVSASGRLRRDPPASS